ncbi:MAG TPA: hypothetical protein VF627_03645 [Abditibacterium sp.]|jgi:hypothetical protein
MKFSVSNASSSDFADILALQEANHLTVLPADARGDGFLTTYLTPQRLEELSAEGGMVIARAQNGELAGFAGAHEWDLTGAREWSRAVLELFPLQLEGGEITAHNSFQYGPACVSSAFRGQGVVAAMLRGVCANYAPKCDFGITFIDFRNARSLAAHERKLGLQIVADLPFDDTIYRVLGFPISAFL